MSFPEMTTDAKPSTIVIGAGLAGCLTSLLLATRGFTVDLYEYRDDPTQLDAEAPPQRSINLAISTRGLTALAQAGLDDRVRALGVPMHGRCVHPVKGELQLQRYGRTGQHLLSVPRGALNQLLLSECAAASGIRIHFGHKCETVDLRESVATFTTADGASKEARADLIIGADGTFSRVRAAFMREPPFDYEQHYVTAAYKEIRLDTKASMPREWLHVWPRHRFMLIALPNPDGTFTCTLFMERTHFDALQTEADVAEFFEEHFPDARALMPDIGADFLQSPTPPLLTVRCAPYHFEDSAVLVGDAAHSMVPFYGQGSQAAFEDCRVLAELVDKHGTNDMQRVLEAYSGSRKPNADAIADLSLDNYVDMASRSAKPGLVMLRKLGVLMNTAFPKSWLPLYTMVSFTNIPYHEAVLRAKKQERLLTGAAAAAAIAALIGVTISAGRLLHGASLTGKK